MCIIQRCKHGTIICPSCDMDAVDASNNALIRGHREAYQDAYDRSLNLQGKALSDWLKAKAEGQ